MRLSEIDKKAKVMGIRDAWKFSKRSLIREIQKREGYAQCFAAVPKGGSCVQMACCWRSDCLK
jgi:hypothetical protein